MKLEKGLMLTMTLSALAALASCTGNTTVKTREWTDAEKKQMLHYANFVLPELPFGEEDIELAFNEQEEGYIGTAYYTVSIKEGKFNAKKAAKWLLDYYNAEDEENSKWERLGEDGTDQVFWAYTTENEEAELGVYIYADMEIGSFQVVPAMFNFEGVKEFVKVQLELYNVGKTFDEVYGEGFNLYNPSMDCKTQFWVDAKETSFRAENFGAIMAFQEATEKTLETAQENLAAADYHAYGWTNSGGEINNSVYTKKGVSGGILLQDAIASNETLIVYFLDGYDKGKTGDPDYYYSGEDTCHPTPVLSEIRKISQSEEGQPYEAVFEAVYSNVPSATFQFTVTLNEEGTDYVITAPEGHTVAIGENGNWFIDGQDTGFEADLNAELANPDELTLDSIKAFYDQYYGATDTRKWGLTPEETGIVSGGAYTYASYTPDTLAAFVPEDLELDQEASTTTPTTKEIPAAEEGAEPTTYEYNVYSLVLKKGNVVLTVDIDVDFENYVDAENNVVPCTVVDIFATRVDYTQEEINAAYDWDTMAHGIADNENGLNGRALSTSNYFHDLSDDSGHMALLGYNAYQQAQFASLDVAMGIAQQYLSFAYFAFDSVKVDEPEEGSEVATSGRVLYLSANGRFMLQVEVYLDDSLESFSVPVWCFDYYLIDLGLEEEPAEQEPVEQEPVEGGEELLRNEGIVLAIAR